MHRRDAVQRPETLDYEQNLQRRGGRRRGNSAPAYLLIDDIIAPYLRFTSEDRRLSTRKAEASCFRRLEDFLRGRAICDDGKVSRKTITGVVVRQYREYRKALGMSPQKIRRDTFHHKLLRAPALARAGLEHIQFHDLRKTAGQRILDATGNAVMVQYQLGHADLRTTQRSYVREPIDLMKKAVREAGL